MATGTDGSQVCGSSNRLTDGSETSWGSQLLSRFEQHSPQSQPVVYQGQKGVFIICPFPERPPHGPKPKVQNENCSSLSLAEAAHDAAASVSLPNTYLEGCTTRGLGKRMLGIRFSCLLCGMGAGETWSPLHPPHHPGQKPSDRKSVQRGRHYQGGLVGQSLPNTFELTVFVLQ